MALDNIEQKNDLPEAGTHKIGEELKTDKKMIGKRLIMTFAITLVVMIGFIDQFESHYLSLLIFYLIPISVGAWFVGRGAGFILLAASATAWFLDDITAPASYLRSAIPYIDIGFKVVFCIFLVYIVSALKRALEQERTLSRIDFLTKVANTKYFFEAANMEVYKARRYKHSLSVAYIDVDNFKLINDRFGHKAGDNVLYIVAQTIKESIRLADMVSRVGGDEFVILFPQTSYEQSEFVINRIQERLLQVVRENKWPITFSMGVITCTSATCSFDALLTVADGLMYSAKKSGKNTIRRKVLD